MTMSRLLLLLAWVMCQGHGRGQGQGHPQCGRMFTGRHGVIQTPHFPFKFPVPLRCRWVIDASSLASEQPEVSIVVYFTQLFVSSGLTFTEFDYYEHDSTFQLGGREIHRVTEQNVTSVQWLMTRRHYLVVDFHLEHLEGNHLRVLDDLLDVYGFNITYDIEDGPRDSCSVVQCSLSGHCYVSQDFREFWCQCFRGFSGPDCGKGPLCQPTSDACEHGATCRQVGATASTCLCPEGFTGARCEVHLTEEECTDDDSCTVQCPEDNRWEPCACGHRGFPLNNDRARYEGTLRLTNVTAIRQCLEGSNCSLKTTLNKQITKYLRSSNLSIMEDLRVLDIGFSGEVRFHFWGGKSEGSKVRETLNRLVQKGSLGNVTLVATHLAITQEPTLHLESVRVNHPRNQVRQGDAFVLSCIAQGSSHLAFRWFKDGVYINITRSKRDIWSRLLPLDSTEQSTALLGVEKADPLDQGTYTCQVQDWGYQQCRSLVLEIMQDPQVRLDPMSVTVEKGENVTVKCMSPNELRHDSRFGYSWTKNNALFKMTPGQEVWEDLYPGGSLLRIINVQRSATYSCHVHGGGRSVSRSMRLEMLNQSVVPWCPTDETGVGGIRWERAGPGVVAKVECPAQYSGIATRLCLLVERRLARWQVPDFSDCASDKIIAVTNNFTKVTLGYGNTTSLDAVFGVLTTLRDRGVIYPGEGEPAIALLHRVASYLNDTSSWDELANCTNYFYSVISTLLLHRNSVINHQKVEELHDTVKMWTELWGRQAGYGSAHLAYDSLVVDLFRFEEPTFRNGLTIVSPRPTLSYPPWFSARVVLHVENNRVYQNTSTSVGIIVFNKLGDFLPLRYSQVLHNGSEVQYEVSSDLVTVVAQGPLRIFPSLELGWSGKTGWELRCGVTNSPSAFWNLTACQSTLISFNRTVCRCPQLGTVGVILVKGIHAEEEDPYGISPSIVLLGCACCFAQTLLTLVLLLLRWWRQHTWFLFLKLQCCTSILATMAIFLYAFSHSFPEKYYPITSTSLQAIILVSLSSHLSKVLMVYTEVVYLPNVHHLKQTIIAVMYGVPLLVVLCNHIAQVSTDTPAASWWLATRTMVFYTSASCGILLVLLFTFLHFHVYKRLKSLEYVKDVYTKRAISKRLGLLHRTAVVFSGTVIMAASSVAYINYPTINSQYLFTLSSALLGFLVLACYVLHCESPLDVHVLNTFNLQPADSSESDSSPISIFTKEDAEVECEGASSRTSRQTTSPNGGSTPVGGYSRVGVIKDQDGSRGLSPDWKNRTSLPLQARLVTVSEKVSKEEHQDMEVYPSSPRRFSKESPEGATSTRVCVITSVVVDTPSVVVCSVDVEPCSVLNKTIVSTGEVVKAKGIEETIPLEDAEDFQERLNQEVEGDVMNRICHDLDYLLGGVGTSSEGSNIPKVVIQNTSL